MFYLTILLNIFYFTILYFESLNFQIIVIHVLKILLKPFINDRFGDTLIVSIRIKAITNLPLAFTFHMS